MSTADWDALGVPPGAGVAEIKSAFRRKVKQCHPDVCPGDESAEARLVRLNRSYERLLTEACSSERLQLLFNRTTPDTAPPTLTAPPIDPFPMEVSARQDMLTRVHQCVQTGLLFVMLLAPVAVLIMGSILFHPALAQIGDSVTAIARADASRQTQAPTLVAIRTDGGGVLLVSHPAHRDH